MKKIPILTTLAASLCLCALSACGGAPQTQMMKAAAEGEGGAAVRLTSQRFTKKNIKAVMGRYFWEVLTRSRPWGGAMTTIGRRR